MNEHYHFYYIKDLLGNIRETYVHPWEGYKECVQRMQYYPSGLPWAESAGASEQPYKYNGKEFVEMHGLDEYMHQWCATEHRTRYYYTLTADTIWRTGYENPTTCCCFSIAVY